MVDMPMVLATPAVGPVPPGLVAAAIAVAEDEEDGSRLMVGRNPDSGVALSDAGCRGGVCDADGATEAAIRDAAPLARPLPPKAPAT